jgi:acyl-coenzyme A thioesterase PaaI-like protein
VDATSLARSLLEPIPAHRTAGITVVHAVDGRAETRLMVPDALHNVIGTLHSSGLVALADATGLAALISGFGHEEDAAAVLPLGASAAMEFTAPARGVLTGRCELSGAAREALVPLLGGASDRARLRTTTHVVDADGTRCATGTFEWSVRLRTPA